MMWQIVPACLLVGVWLYWRYKNKKLIEMAKKIPGPPALPFVGNALKFMCQPEEQIRVFKYMITEYGDVFKFWLAADLNIVVSNPEDIKLLLTNNKTSVKGPQYKYMADVLGGGILSGSGAAWRRHRKIASPNYTKRAIQSYTDVFNSEVDLLILKFSELSKANAEDIDIYNYIVQTTSWTVCQTLMGLSREETMKLPHLQTLIDLSPEIYDIIFNRMTKWYLKIDPVFWLTRSYKVLKDFVVLMNEFGEAIKKHREKKLANIDKKLYLLNSEEDSLKNTQLSVIDRFILSNELDAKELFDETFTIFTSSQEASAKISSFFMLMMAYHPKCQEKLYAEISNVIDDNTVHITDEHIKQMPYLEMAFKEVLRLFPTGGLLQRTINDDILISSQVVLPAGSSLTIPIYYIHRDPRFWEDPEAFNPERFNPENSKKRPTYSYIPFSLGPMDCLGRYFGSKLIKTVVIKVLQKFKLSSTHCYQDLRIAISISATSIDGFYAILKPRRNC